MSKQTNFTDITKSFLNLKVQEKKKGKRTSLTDSETSDNPPAPQSSRSRGVGGGVVTNWKGTESVRDGNHARALQEIKVSLQPFAASELNPESVHSLALELNVDQAFAENVAKSSATLEIARETLIQILKKKMRDEQQYQRANSNKPMRPLSGHDYPVSYYLQPREQRNHRGSPDGASFRAESPQTPIFNPHNGHSNKVAQVNSLRQKLTASDYDVYSGKNHLDTNKIAKHYVTDRTPATDPPAYPGSQTSYTTSVSYSRRSSNSDNGSGDLNGRTTHHNSLPRPNHLITNPNATTEVQYRRGQTSPLTVGYLDRTSGSGTSVNAGVMPGHVQQMVRRMSPAGPPPQQPDGVSFYQAYTPRQVTDTRHQPVVSQMSSSSLMRENHKPIIKGPVTSNLNQHSGPSIQSGSRYPSNHPPPPPYNVAQQFKNKQKELGQPAYSSSDAAFGSDMSRQPQVVTRSSPAPYQDQQQQWSNPINGALMGNINYSAYQYPSGHSSSPQSSMSSGYQGAIVEPCHAHYQTLPTPQIIQPVKSKPVDRPQPMQVETPRNSMGHPHYGQIMVDPDMQDVQLHAESLPYNLAMPQDQYRDPPPYVDSRSGSTSLTNSDITMGYYEHESFPSDECNRLRKPSVADSYLSAVDNNVVGGIVPVGKPPRGTESAVQAARVTASNSKRQHASSYSAVAAAKQHKPGSISGTHDTQRPKVVDVPPEPAHVDDKDKTVSLSPVPVRKHKKKPKSSQRNANFSDSEEEEEQVGRSRIKMFSSDAYKFYMEQHIENLFKNCQSRASRRNQLEQEMVKNNLPNKDQCQMREMLFQKESNYMRLKRGKIDLSMFRVIKPLGVGAFGKVYLSCRKTTGQLFAIKTLRKKDVLTRNQVAHVKAERDILSEADNDWVVKLYYTFQDKQFLYFVMDYIPGGDMMSLLIKKGIFEESLARFYTAELTLALESVHKMGFIHRDIKPDNILIDRDGHIKLTDFGLCTGFRWTHDSKYYQRGSHRQQDSMDFSSEWQKYNPNGLKTLDRRRLRDANRKVAKSLVGTPNYIAPEVLLREGYTQLCDWWSVGVILYEMVVGQPPFNAETPEETQWKVINYRDVLYFPDTSRLKSYTKDIIRRLCCDQRERIGCNGIEEIKCHPYFKRVDWYNLRRTQAPFVPKIRYAEDTSNFDTPDEYLFNQSQAGTLNNTLLKAGEHAFFEFTFRRFFDEDGRAYSSGQHYTPDDDMTIDEAAELADRGDYTPSYCQANGEWESQNATSNRGRVESNNSFYL